MVAGIVRGTSSGTLSTVLIVAVAPVRSSTLLNPTVEGTVLWPVAALLGNVEGASVASTPSPRTADGLPGMVDRPVLDMLILEEMIGMLSARVSDEVFAGGELDAGIVAVKETTPSSEVSRDGRTKFTFRWVLPFFFTAGAELPLLVF